MLEDMRAEDEIEPTVLEGHVLDEPDHVGVGGRHDVESDVLRRDVREERQVGLRPTSDIERTLTRARADRSRSASALSQRASADRTTHCAELAGGFRRRSSPGHDSLGDAEATSRC